VTLGPKPIVFIFSFLLELVGSFGAQETIGSSLTSWSVTPKHIAHRAFGFLQQWCALLTKEAWRKAEELLIKLHMKLQAL